MRTIILCTLLTLGILNLSFSCCKETFWDITGFKAEVMDKGYRPTNSGQITTDTLILRLDLDLEILNRNQASIVGPNCPNGTLGMLDQLTDLTVTSSANFNNYTQGTSLAPIITVGDSIPLEDWIMDQHFNIFDYHPSSLCFLYLNEKPSSNSNIHDFKITLTFASGRTEEAQLGAITWN